jgi:hypothetical protein
MASRAEWQRRVMQWKKSGLTAELFAAQQGLTPGTLRWWSSALRRPAVQGAELGIARLVAADVVRSLPQGRGAWSRGAGAPEHRAGGGVV